MQRLYLFCFIGFFGISVLLSAAPAAKATTDVSALNDAVDGMQKFWDKTKTFQANFTQVVFAKRLGTRDTAAGKLFISKPNKLRWESKEDGSFQIMNGNTLTYVHYNKRRQNWIVDILENTNKSVDTKALQFLAGKANFKKSYTAKLEKDAPKSLEIRLIPIEGGSESYIAEVEKKSYVIQSLTTETVDTRARIEFTNIQTNKPLEDSLFKYVTKPSDVVHKEN